MLSVNTQSIRSPLLEKDAGNAVVSCEAERRPAVMETCCRRAARSASAASPGRCGRGLGGVVEARGVKVNLQVDLSSRDRE